MNCKILATSFATWKAHHVSNSSDDLLGAISSNYPQGVAPRYLQEVAPVHLSNSNTYLLRKVTVDFELAPRQVISMIDLLKPEILICCGMAENRDNLTVESNGKSQTEILETKIDLNHLTEGTIATQISHDAGNFVCNHLYYSVLKYLQNRDFKCQCIFVHVPVLNGRNFRTIVEDFLMIVDRLNAGKFLLK
ncbi:pyroglutamyl-peptidase I family protein [Phormidesmis sp. 146-33]